MTDALFAVTELTQSANLLGHRLTRLELYNWGTFDGAVHIVRTDGHNTLLTGGNGTGKSTIVDALTTLLVPAQKISYNKASGAGANERNIASYTLGHYRQTRDESTGRTIPESLRDTGQYSVILAVFDNAGTGQTTTIAQVLWFARQDANRPERLFVIADQELAIGEHFAEFNGQRAHLVQQLQELGAQCPASFREYARECRRALGIPTSQAVQLFHQTMSLKSVDDLNDFVRTYMLESFAGEAKIAQVLAHYEDLRSAHEQVVAAEAKLALLEPIVAQADRYDQAERDLRTHSTKERLLAVVAAQLKHQLLTDTARSVTTKYEQANTAFRDVALELTKARAQQKTLEARRDGFGGGRIRELAATTNHLRSQLQERMTRHSDLAGDAEMAGLGVISSTQEWATALTAAKTALPQAQKTYEKYRQELYERSAEVTQAAEHVNAAHGDLTGLKNHRGNIPNELVHVRQQLCDALDIPVTALPFIGEHVQLDPAERQWENVAERVLAGLATSLMVPTEHYLAVSEWLENRQTGCKIVYFTIDPQEDVPVAASATGTLAAKVQVKPSRFANWLQSQVNHRANHRCAETLAEFRAADRAVTQTGQIKSGQRHEKDDRHPVGDRRRFVLGWDNHTKLAALTEHLAQVQAEHRSAQQAHRQAQSAAEAAASRIAILHRIVGTRIEDVDHWSTAALLESTQAELASLESAHDGLSQIIADLEDVQAQIKSLEARQAKLGQEQGALAEQKRHLTGTTEQLTAVLSMTISAEEQALVPHLTEEFSAAARADLQLCEVREEQLRAEFRSCQDVNHMVRDQARDKAVRAMSTFLTKFPTLANRLDASIAAREDFRTVQQEILRDDLPRHRSAFEDNLHRGVLTEMAMLTREFDRHEEQLELHLAAINESLFGIDYNPGRYIRLNKHRTRNQEVQEFRNQLKECTQAAGLSGDQPQDLQTAQETFTKIQGLLDRFQGRPHLAEVDKRWRALVTDVRQWYTFSASENHRKDDSEYESYSGSGGKSGGQKEKLAYTILAASLAYQFKLKIGASVSETFHLAIIDEAFGRSESATTKYGMELFAALGIQLVLVTPLQKVNTIAQYAQRVVLVDKHNDRSRLSNLTLTPGDPQQRSAQVFATEESTADQLIDVTENLANADSAANVDSADSADSASMVAESG